MSKNYQVTPLRIVIQLHGDDVKSVVSEGPIPVEYAVIQTCFDSTYEDIKTNIDGARYVGNCGMMSTKDNLKVLRTFIDLDTPEVWQADRDRRHVENNGLSCPCCGGNSIGIVDGSDLQNTGETIITLHSCNNCKATWKSIYCLNGLVEVKRKPVAMDDVTFVFYPLLMQHNASSYRAISIHGVTDEDAFDAKDGYRPDNYLDDITPEYYAAYLHDGSGYQVCYAECGKGQLLALRQFAHCLADSLDVNLTDFTMAKGGAR